MSLDSFSKEAIGAAMWHALNQASLSCTAKAAIRGVFSESAVPNPVSEVYSAALASRTLHEAQFMILIEGLVKLGASEEAVRVVTRGFIGAIDRRGR